MPVRASFITWYPYCRRSDALAEALGGRSHLIHYLGFKRPLHAPLKYALQAYATAGVLARERPDVVLVAVPPVFAALPVLAHARRHAARVVIDAHTGIFDHPRWRWLLPLTRIVCRHADAVVVTGPHLARTVASWGARPIVIGDVPVEFGAGRPPAPCAGPRVVVVNTFSIDEPIAEILEAARQLPDARLFVTGDLRAAPAAAAADPPSNVTFTGFVAEEDYAGLLRAADVVVVLTTRDHTMQRGAYEALALGKPLVTSDWGLLRETFSRGTVHVQNRAPAIAAGVRRALAERAALGAAMDRLRAERAVLFEQRLERLREAVVSPPAAAGGLEVRP
jgi:glycosyltransferase involved in cell wall biosynthesis